MTALWTSKAIADATQGIASADFQVSGVAFDSREIGPGDLFVALKGEATDGHRFVDGALANGAAGAIVSEPISGPHILVSDTGRALDALGMGARQRTEAKIIGVTGSVGKTGTKEALAAALARGRNGPVHRSVKSFNNHTGVPLSLARMPAQSRYGVFEMGMNHAGEIAALTKLVRPHVALITAIAPAHIEFFASIEGIADAKAEIFQGLVPGGTAIIPYDSPHRDRLIAHAKNCSSQILTFGTEKGADVRAIDTMAVSGGTAISAELPDVGISFTLSQPGDHWVSNAMAVLATVSALGGDLAAAALSLSDFDGLAGRGARHRIKIGDGEALLIDESYNANPTSMLATLKVLGDTKADRRIVILGAMRELGEESDALHAKLADPIIAAGVDCAILVGSGIEPLQQALSGQISCVHWQNAAAAQKDILERMAAGDAILIKGSNAIGLAQIVNTLKGEKG